jgi:hypothetical protein
MATEGKQRQLGEKWGCDYGVHGDDCAITVMMKVGSEGVGSRA